MVLKNTKQKKPGVIYINKIIIIIISCEGTVSIHYCHLRR